MLWYLEKNTEGEVITIKVLQIISGNDNGGGGNHVLNLSFHCKNKFTSVVAALGRGDLYENGVKMGLEMVQFNRKSFQDGTVLNYIKENSIDIVNFHGAKAFFMYLLLKNKLTIPAVATIHSDYKKDFLNNKLKYIFFTPLSILGIKAFKYYIGVSSYIVDILNKDRIKGKKFIVNNGIDYSNIKIIQARETLRENLNIGKDDFVYVNIARMHPIKNQLSLIEAFYKLKENNDDVKLVIVGDGPLRQVIEEKIKSLNLQQNVLLIGFSNVPLDYVNIGEVGILTSFSEGGCPPLVLLESGVLKKTFICSNVGDMNKVLDENTGFLVDPHSIEDIYYKMKKAYDEKTNIKIMGENLYSLVKEKYSIDTFCEAYYKAYSEILSEK